MQRFQFEKRAQLFISAHNETLSVATMCINNLDCSSGRTDGCHGTPTRTGFAEIVSDDFPVLHPDRRLYLVIQNRLHRGLAHFKLCAHLLDLRRLFFEPATQELNFLPLLRVL